MDPQSDIHLHVTNTLSLKIAKQLHLYELPSKKMVFRAYLPTEEAVQSAHLLLVNLIRAFTLCSMNNEGPLDASYRQQRLLSDCADVQADQSLHWLHILEYTLSYIYLFVCV